MYSDISLNYSAMTQRFDNFFDFLVTLMKDRRVLILIYKLDDGYSQEIYQRLNALKEYDAKEIKDPGKPFWQLAFFETPLPPAPPPVYHGETVLDGNELLKCRLRLESVNGKRFRVWLKNVSSQPLEFKDFRKENLLLSDLASDGPYFEVREVMVYYIYPPLESDVPENFTLAPGEEKEFSFPVVGSRFRRGHGWKIFDAKAEETLDFKPTEVEIMKKTNRNYNFYDVAVYFYRDGKKYKAFKQDFVDGITFSQP